jgi:hypothetical protein
MKTNDTRRKGGSLGKLKLLSLTCAESARLQSEGLDRQLTRLERFGLRVHLVLCAGCRRYGRQLRLLRNALRGFPKDDSHLPEGSLSEESRARIKQSMRQ